jgi:hypothetical protein
MISDTIVEKVTENDGKNDVYKSEENGGKFNHEKEVFFSTFWYS